MFKVICLFELADQSAECAIALMTLNIKESMYVLGVLKIPNGD